MGKLKRLNSDQSSIFQEGKKFQKGFPMQDTDYMIKK